MWGFPLWGNIHCSICSSCTLWPAVRTRLNKCHCNVYRAETSLQISLIFNCSLSRRVAYLNHEYLLTFLRILLFCHLLTLLPPSSGGRRSGWGYYLGNWRSLLKLADEAGWDGEEWKWKGKTDQIPNYPPLYSYSFFLALTGLKLYSGGSFYFSHWPWHN